MTPIQLPDIRGVQNSGIATISIPVGPTLNGVMLALGGTSFTKAHVTQVQFRGDSKPFFTTSGPIQDLINAYHGDTVVSDHIWIPFCEKDAKTLGGIYGGQVVTEGVVQSLTAEVTIAGATSPTLTEHAMVQEAPKANAAGRDLLAGMFYRPEPIAGADTWPVVLPYGRNSQRVIKRVYFSDPDDIITALTVKKNGIPIHENVSRSTMEAMQKHSGKVPQSNFVVYDPVLMGDMKRSVNAANARHMQFDVTCSGQGTIHIYEQVLGKLRLF